eukprot:IDg9526t1
MGDSHILRPRNPLLDKISLSRDIRESWAEFVAYYLQVARYCSLLSAQKTKSTNYVNSFQQAVDVIERDYISAVRQNTVKE